MKGGVENIPGDKRVGKDEEKEIIPSSDYSTRTRKT
jgi:hypothetical protein